MNNNQDIYNFLKSNGFKQVKEEISKYFGDYYVTFVYYDIELRFCSSKSFETIEIRYIEEKATWYDLALIKALLFDKEILSNIFTMEEQIDFLKKEFNQIMELFNKLNYQTSKKKLDKLGQERIKQLFPKMT